MIVPLEQLKNYDFELSNMNVIYQKPSYRFLNNRGRIPNGFLCISHGSCVYTFRGGEFVLEPGSVAYLPSSSVHKLYVTSDKIEFYRVDFTIKIQGEIVLFSDGPLKMTGSAPKEFMEAVCTLADNYLFENDSIAKTECMCTMFRSLQANSVRASTQQLAPAIRYLHENLAEGADCRELAALCSLSTAQFYNLFHKEYGTTPLEYRNRLLMRRAILLLRSGDVTVSEVAGALGFESVAYFSRFFKKHQGVSPSEYRKSL